MSNSGMTSEITPDIDIDISTLSATSTSSSSSISTFTSPSPSASSSVWSSRPSLHRIFTCSNAELHDLILNHPEWCDVNAIYPAADPELQSPPSGRHHLLSYAVHRGDIERIHILTQHPYIQCDVNQFYLANERKIAALAYVAHAHIDDVLRMRLMSLLALLCADPNLQMFSFVFNLTPLDCVLRECSNTVVEHFITIFHPINRGVTCTIPCDFTHRIQTKYKLQPQIIAQRRDPISQQIINIITTIMKQLITQQRANMHTFSMATHPHVGRSSAVYRIFCCSPMYDPHLLQLIWRFLYISETLPTSQQLAYSS